VGHTEWLEARCGVRRSVCLAVDAESGLLVGLAGSGVRTADVERYAWPAIARRLEEIYASLVERDLPVAA
jgi:hypothetical protein